MKLSTRGWMIDAWLTTAGYLYRVLAHLRVGHVRFRGVEAAQKEPAPVKQPDTTTPTGPITEEASPSPEEETSVTFSFEAGRLVRDDIIFQTRSLALRCGARIEVVENRGWIESAYAIQVSGAYSAVKVFCDSWNAWNRKLRTG